MKGWDPEGLTGPKKPLPDSVTILEPPIDKVVNEPTSESKEPVAVPVAPAAEESAYAAQEGGYPQDTYGEQPVAF